MRLVEPSPRIAGIGWALFLSLLLLVILLLLTRAFPTRKQEIGLYTGLCVLYVIIVLSLPKVNVGSYYPEEPAVVDSTWYPKLFFAIFIAIGGLLGFVFGPILGYVFVPVHAKIE